MEKMSAKEIAATAQGHLISGSAERTFSGLSIDSRTIKDGELFVAIVGEWHDAHRFIGDALRRGARGLVISSDNVTVSDDQIPVVRVSDTTGALIAIAHHYRKKFSIPLVAVTGSNGKTTVKDFIHTLASGRMRVHRTAGTRNNHIGLPLTLLGLRSDTEAAVVEFGMNHPGEIDKLTRTALPTIGIIVNVNVAHIEYFGSLKEIADAKAEMIDHLSSEESLILNADCDWYDYLASKAGAKIVSFSIKGDANIVARDLDEKKHETSFTLLNRLTGDERRVKLAVPGLHNVSNALAAAAACFELGMSADEIADGFGRLSLPHMRLQVEEVADVTIVNDTYNANPASMNAALGFLSRIEAGGRRILVAGDMLELGSHSINAHKDLGRVLRRAGIEYLIAYGPLTWLAAEAAAEHGFEQSHITCVNKPDDAVAVLVGIVEKGDLILVKGSRLMRMEKIVDSFRAKLVHAGV